MLISNKYMGNNPNTPAKASNVIMESANAVSKNSPKIPVTWEKWCKTGKHGRGARKKNAVMKCLQSGHVRGYFSDLVLRPDLADTDSMYPSLEHLVDPKNHTETVVEARIINDMKSHLSETEFWQVIEHLFIVGIEKKKIAPPFGKRLPKGWSPKRHYANGGNIRDKHFETAIA